MPPLFHHLSAETRRGLSAAYSKASSMAAGAAGRRLQCELSRLAVLKSSTLGNGIQRHFFPYLFRKRMLRGWCHQKLTAFKFQKAARNHVQMNVLNWMILGAVNVRF